METGINWASKVEPPRGGSSPAPSLRAFNEGRQHRAAKAALGAALRVRGLEVAAEAAAGQARRADLLVTSPAGRAVAIEIQHSAISFAEVRQRTADHAAAGIATLWLPVLDLPDRALRPIDGARGLLQARIALPAWIEWLEGRAGALWVWRGGALWRGWMAPAWIRTDDRGHTDAGECGWRPSTRLRTLTLEGPVTPDQTRLIVRPALALPDQRFATLAGPCATLLRTGEAAPTHCPTTVDWTSAPDGVRPVVRLVQRSSVTRH